MPLILNTELAGLIEASVHHWATLWRIERTDAQVMLFTDHDVPIAFTYTDTEEEYLPAGAFDASAREKQAGIRDHNAETTGVLMSDAITDDDLRAGKYAEAKVVEMLVDYRHPYASWIQKNVYYVTNLSYTKEVWTAQLSAQPVWLRKDIGTVLNNTCRHKLYEGICGQGINREDFRVGPFSVTSVQTRRLKLTADDLTQAAGYFALGELTWVTGANAGRTDEILVHEAGGIITFPLQTAYEILADDTFTVVPGCDRLPTTCKTKFNSFVNFGGFPAIPGSDKMIGGLIP